jgi:adenine deaminase
MPQAIRAITELGASSKRCCICTDDRDADDLFHFGLDWGVQQAIACGLKPCQAWSMGSLHSATRFGMDGEIGGLGGGRRADVVLLNDRFEVQNTWYGGDLVVEHGKITPLLDEQLSTQRYSYPAAAYRTVTLPTHPPLLPALPAARCEINVIQMRDPRDIALYPAVVALEAGSSWQDHLDAHDLCFLSVLERHGKSGEVAHGFLQGFGLRHGAVASSVGHDAHNIIVAGSNEADMRLAVETIRAHGGGVIVVSSGVVQALVPLPIAGLLSDLRATEIASLTTRLKQAWNALGCRMPYMGFSLISLSVIPEIRLTDKGLVMVPQMTQLPLIRQPETALTPLPGETR